MGMSVPVLDPSVIRHFDALRDEAINSVSARFFSEHAGVYAAFGERGQSACREDLGFHLEFLRPVLEFGLLAPMVDYLRWMEGVLAARDVPTQHLGQSLDWLGEFFTLRLPAADGDLVAGSLREVKFALEDKSDVRFPIDARLLPAWPETDGFEAALLKGDRRMADTIMDECIKEGRNLVDAERHMIQPAMYRIGQAWQENRVSVAQEHLSSAIAQAVMVRGLIKSEPRPPNGKKVLLACVEGNDHALGLQMVADAFDLAGWAVNFLGANTPTVTLVKHCCDWQPDLLGLSLSFPWQLRSVKDVLARLNNTLGRARPPLIIGGLAINNFEQLAANIGADAWASDAAAAVNQANRLVGPPAQA